MNKNREHHEGVVLPYKSLITVGGICAVISAAIIPISIIAFFFWPLYPEDIFSVIQSNRLAGMMGLDLIYLLGSFLSIPIFLTFYVTLKQTNESYSLLALTLGLIGLVTLFSSRPILEIVSLSDQYALVTTEIQKTELQAAGTALMTLFRGTAFNIHYVLGTTSLLISSFLMMKSEIYSKSTAYIGIITNILVFTYYVPTVGVYLSIVSVIGYLLWWSLLGKQYIQMSSTDQVKFKSK
ncbi:MAG: DUF4386 family protein [Anaerolineales bacterium]|jgi:hypothetical protein